MPGEETPEMTFVTTSAEYASHEQYRVSVRRSCRITICTKLHDLPDIPSEIYSSPTGFDRVVRKVTECGGFCAPDSRKGEAHTGHVTQ